MQRMGREAQRTGRQIQNAGKTISGVGSSLTKGITAPVAGIAAGAIKTAADFESSMSKVGAISGKVSDKELPGIIGKAKEMGLSFKEGANASETAMNVLKAKAQQMGAATSFSASESAEAMQYMAMAGWKTGDMMDGIAGIMDLAAASGESLGKTSDIVTDGLTAFNMTAKQSGRFADVMAATSSNANTNVALMGETFKYCASTAGAMKYSVEDISVAIGLMGNAGIKGSMAGTTLKNTIANLAKPTDSQAAVMKKLGISLTDGNGKMKSFAGVMQNLRSSFSGLSEKEKAAAATTIAGKQSMAGLLTIVNASQKDFNKLTKAINNSKGAAGEMAEKMLQNLNGQITLLKSAIEAIAIRIGDVFLPALTKITKRTQLAATSFNGLSDSQVKTIVKFAGIAAAIGPALMIFGKMVMTVGKVQMIYGKMLSTVARFGGVLGMITSPAGIVIGVLAGIALAAVLIIKNWDKVKSFVSGIGSWFKKAFESAGYSVNFFKVVFSGIVATIKNIVRTVKNIVKVFISVFTGSFSEGLNNGTKKPLKSLQKFITDINAVLKFDKALKTIQIGLFMINNVLIRFVTGGGLSKAINTLKPIASGLGQVFKTVFGFIGTFVVTAVKTIIAILPSAVGAIGTAITAVIPLAQKIISVVGKVVAIIASTLVKTLKSLSPVIKILGNAVKVIIPVIGSLLAGAFRTAGNIIAKIAPVIARIASAIGGLLLHAVKKISPVVLRLAKTFSKAFSSIAKIVSSTSKKLTPAFNTIKTIIKVAMGVVSKVVGVAFNAVGNAASNAADTLKSVIDGIVKVFDGLITFVTGVFTANWTQAWEGIKGIFKGIFDSLVGLCKTPINAVIGLINGAIKGINSLSVDIPEGVPFVGGKHIGFNIPTIPMLYKGTSNWQGGTAIIHDRGGEIVDLPKGSRVYPHDMSVEMARKDGAKGITINIQKLADSIIVRNDEDIDRIAEAFAYKLKAVAFNTGMA